MAQLLKPDICVIGASAGGLAVATAAAAYGVPTVLIERGRMGSDRLNHGCIASKALIAAAKRAHAIREADPFGVIGDASIDFSKVHACVRDVIRSIAPSDSKEHLTGLGVRVISGAARFKNRRAVLVGDGYEIRARRFVIATGSSPRVPEMPGILDTPYLTNETIFDLTECPEHLIVLGGSPTGIELAQAYRRLGAKVTVLEPASPLPTEDAEAAAVVLCQVTREGVLVRGGVKVTAVGRTGTGVKVLLAGSAEEETIEGSHLLIATGRRANLAELGLKAGGIRYDPRGVKVNKRLKTRNRRVYAIGDAVQSSLQLTHVANHHADLVVRNALFRTRIDARESIIPCVTYTDPELAQIGLQEAEAKKRFRRIRVLRAPFHENDRAQTERATQGHIKAVTLDDGRILGVTIVGTGAGEQIATWALAISQGLKVDAIADLVLPHPTYSEIGKRAALSYYMQSPYRPPLRRIIRFLRIFG